ncbi:NAD(P)/FAD-dependent oxidoreductase [Pseudonocardia kujensis]|uniref:NAD(P)/FAD-dependent oxidoreductase n=1 Tax=Pseudonocardia kujensis TaxID=1128675 RepID=UPI001E5E1E49|nr:NAD(P)/FAD-dependent oxidoreductase [Pseudonocardia kujensis]MCE0767759.1 NAD(P)/FAD-dependent oxidoreductase [Pseudonocardia kujensis]
MARPDRLTVVGHDGAHGGPHRVVIVGGGFAGLFAARALRDPGIAVTLVDRAQHHLFQPLLYQVATGILSEGQIAAPLRDVLKRHRTVECVLADAVDVDPQARTVLAERPNGERLTLAYDDLILAAGVRQSYFGHDEFARYALGMKTIADALAIRRRVFGAFELAETATDPDEQRRWLTFAVVGAGPTGVELAGQIRELATRTLRKEFHRIRPEDARVLLFDAGKAPLASFGPALSAKAAAGLRALGVELHLGSVVTGVDARGIDVSDVGEVGEVGDGTGATHRYPAGTVLWAAGVEAPPIAKALADATGAPRDRAGRIEVEPDLTVPGHPEICVIGDLMSLHRLPGVAEVAMQTGFYAGRRIRNRLRGHPVRPFRYHDLGSAAYLSRGNAVVSAGPAHFGGFAGWLAWLFLHLAFLTGYRNRVGAVLTWTAAFARDARRERTFTTQEIETLGDVYDQAGTGTAGAAGAAGAAHPAPAETTAPAESTAPTQSTAEHVQEGRP